MKKAVLIAVALITLTISIGGVVASRYGAKQSLPVASPAAPAGRYVALGDSVAAGLGLAGPVQPATCGRTEAAYPNQLAQWKGLRLETFACSGATFAAGIREPQTVATGPLAAQLENLRQTDRPSLLSLTGGANDLAWTNVLRSCYQSACGTAADSRRLMTAIEIVGTDLRASLQTIAKLYPSNAPRTVVTGYYKVLPTQAATGCLESTGLGADELDWWQRQETALNDVLHRAVDEFGFARFAAVDFSGHDSCAADPWVQGLTDPAPFHPTVAGQTAIARAVQRAAQ